MTTSSQDDSTPLSRRQFLQQSGLGASALLLGNLTTDSCTTPPSLEHITGKLLGPNHQLGHLLRKPDLSAWASPKTPFVIPPVDKAHDVDILIIGGGISGLSARRWLHQQGITDVLLLEMESQPGGNSASGQNEISAYSWGAHYLPIPDVRNRDLLDFLAQANVISQFDEQGLPHYNDYHLCHDPEERLFINGYWQEGLIPLVGVPADEQAQIARFLALIEQLKTAKGTDGRDAFAIPLDQSSTDASWRKLDSISFNKYLTDQGFTSSYLRWYLTYACKDDYGATLETTSAWAGLHYFASRKGQAANASASAVLTWPEGNAFLAQQLNIQANSPIMSNTLAQALRIEPDGVYVRAIDAKQQQTVYLRAQKVVLATPQFITQRLIQDLAPERKGITQSFQYAPWLVANLTVTDLPQDRGMPLCWDNVLYGTDSVGYIVANHQSVSQPSEKQVITVYWPLTQQPPDLARRTAYQTTYEQWLQQILDELEKAHAGITASVQEAVIWVWGHGMIAPTPGFVWGEARKQATAPIDNKVFFAHSDLSGISLFEEAFYQGIRAAKAIQQVARTALLLFLPLFFLLSCQTKPHVAWPAQVGAPILGSAFYKQAAAMTWKQRDSLAVKAILAGNVPVFLRKFTPIHLSLPDSGTSRHAIRAIIFVSPDYLSIGSDEDWGRIPLTPMAAQQLADSLHCFLPTRKLVDVIYAAAIIKLEPVPMYAFRDSTPTMWHHHLIIEGQRQRKKGLIAGIKKDVVISGKLTRDTRPNREAIYGWHKLDGKPIQPLYTGHVNWWVDYSHGIRLIYRKINVNGKWMDYEEVLNDSRLQRLLCDEPYCDFSRYRY